MKVHITNLYNFNEQDKLVQKQHAFAEIGRSLGFREMGIFAYPVETDTPNELSKRLDGVIAALEQKDVVFVQLPTENGYEYERLLISKIKSYTDTKVILVLHNTDFLGGANDDKQQSPYISLCRKADAVIAPRAREGSRLRSLGISRLFFCDKYSSGGDWYLKKVLVDARESVCALDNSTFRRDIRDEENEIHIGFGLYDKTGNYTVWVGVAMQSIIEHTDAAVCFHVLHDETLNRQNRERLMQVAANGGQRVLFHFLDKTMFHELTSQMGIYTIGALFRIMLPEMLPELKKIIYLDADILANRDIKGLWDINIENYCMAAVPDVDVVRCLVRPIAVKRGDVPASRYFNSGVIYMNLERIRARGNMREAILEYLQQTKDSNLPDQDALNVVYGEETLLLDGVWNTFVRPLQNNSVKALEPRIYHFVGCRCILYTLTGVDRLYYETTSRTPWGEQESRMQLEKSLFRINARVEIMEKLLHSCADTEKKHIFYGEETYAMRNAYNLVSVREGDYRVVMNPLDEPNCTLPCKKWDTLVHEKSPYLVFVLPDADDWKAIANLEALGLKNEKDFFVIPMLLPPAKGGYM